MFLLTFAELRILVSTWIDGVVVWSWEPPRPGLLHDPTSWTSCHHDTDLPGPCCWCLLIRPSWTCQKWCWWSTRTLQRPLSFQLMFSSAARMVLGLVKDKVSCLNQVSSVFSLYRRWTYGADRHGNCRRKLLLGIVKTKNPQSLSFLHRIRIRWGVQRLFRANIQIFVLFTVHLRNVSTRSAD